MVCLCHLTTWPGQRFLTISRTRSDNISAAAAAFTCDNNNQHRVYEQIKNAVLNGEGWDNGPALHSWQISHHKLFFVYFSFLILYHQMASEEVRGHTLITISIFPMSCMIPPTDVGDKQLLFPLCSSITINYILHFMSYFTLLASLYCKHWLQSIKYHAGAGRRVRTCSTWTLSILFYFLKALTLFSKHVKQWNVSGFTTSV